MVQELYHNTIMPLCPKLETLHKPFSLAETNPQSSSCLGKVVSGVQGLIGLEFVDFKTWYISLEALEREYADFKVFGGDDDDEYGDDDENGDDEENEGAGSITTNVDDVMKQVLLAVQSLVKLQEKEDDERNDHTNDVDDDEVDMELEKGHLKELIQKPLTTKVANLRLRKVSLFYSFYISQNY